jgi:uncharacterized membrane protein YkoI
MRLSLRFAAVAAAVLAFAPARGEDAAAPAHDGAAPAHICLDQKERRNEIEAGRVVRLGVAMHAAKTRMAGTVVRARLCRGKDGLVYVLTVLPHDGKVARITIDAAKGTLVGGR